jgi:Flp pilus assembly protein TadD
MVERQDRKDLAGSRGRIHVGVCLFLVAAVLSVYAQTYGHDYLNLDDDVYVVENPHVRDGLSVEGIAWAFTRTHEAYWLPLTWISLMADVELYGVRAGPHLLTNAALHVVAAVLLYGLLLTTTGAAGASAWVAAVFAVHPIHVESVAWVSQRKDVLSTLFWMLTALGYVRYTRRPGMARYLGVLIAFSLGLLAKPTLVTLPFVLLLLDYWPLGRADAGFKRLVVEKLPLAAIAAAASVVTLATQTKAGAVHALGETDVAMRLGNVAAGYLRYLGKLVCPSNLTLFYPLAPIPVDVAAGAALAIGAATVAAVALRRRAPYAAVGWAWYLGVLVPVIGFVQVGGQALADRYVYLASIGPTIALAWGLAWAVSARPTAARALAAVAAISVVGMALLSHRQVGYWRDSIVAFERAVAVTENNFLAHNNLGEALARAGRTEEAGEHYAKAVRIHPGYPPARNNLGTYLAKQGRYAEATEHFEAALRIDPQLSAAENNLATIHARSGRSELAIEHYRRALAVDPHNAHAHSGLADVLLRAGRRHEAASAYRAALRLRPEWDTLRAALARAQSDAP